MFDTNQQFDNYNPEFERVVNENTKFKARIRQLEVAIEEAIEFYSIQDNSAAGFNILQKALEGK